RHDHLHLAQHGRALFQQAKEQSPPGNTLRLNRRQFPRLQRHRLHQALASPFVNMTYEGYAIETLSQAVARFREKHPKVTVHAWVGNSEDICARVLAGKADI